MPVAAFDFIREAKLQGNVLNHYGFGGYLISSGIKTFIDGRGELYRRRLHQALRRDRRTAGTSGRSRRRSTNSTSTGRFSRRTMAANKILAHLPNWKRVYGDDTATIFVRQR